MKKTLLKLLTLVLVLCSAVCLFTACGGGGNNNNNNYGPNGVHNKEDSTVSDLFDGMMGSITAINENEGVVITIDSQEVTLKNMPLTYSQSVDQYKEVVANFNGQIDGEMFIGTDQDGLFSVKGAILGEVDAIVGNATFAKVDFKAYVVVEKGVAYLKYDLNLKYVGLSEELQALNNITQSGDFSIALEDIVELVLGDGAIEKIAGVSQLINGIITENSDFINNEILPLINRIWNDVDDTVEQLMNVSFNSMFTVKTEGEKKVVVYDYDKLLANSNDVYNLDFKTYMDKYLGTNSFANFKQKIVGLFDLKLKDMLYYVFTNDGLTIGELEAEINEIAKTIDPEFTSISDMLQLLEGATVEQWINSPQVQAILDYTVGEMICISSLESDMPTDPAVVAQLVGQLKTELGKSVDEMGELNYYDILINLIGANGAEIKTQIKQVVDGMINLMKSSFGFKAVFSSEGAFEKIEMTTGINGEKISDFVELIQDMFINSKPSVTADGTEVGASGALWISALGSANVKFVTTVAIGEFANALEVDYDAIVQEIIDGNEPSGEAEIPGTYKFYSVEFQGETYYEGDSSPWGETLLADNFVMVLSEDGTVVASQVMEGESATFTGAWTYVDGIFVLTIDGDDILVTVGANALTYSVGPAGNQMTYTFAKV